MKSEHNHARQEGQRPSTFHAQIAAFHGNSSHVGNTMNVAPLELQGGVL